MTGPKTTLAYGAAREHAGEKPDTQELILQELREIRKLLEERKNEKGFNPYKRIGTP